MSTVTHREQTAERLRSAIARLGGQVAHDATHDELLEALDEATSASLLKLHAAEGMVSALVQAQDVVSEGLVVIGVDGELVHQAGVARAWLARRPTDDEAARTLAEVIEVARSGSTTTRTLELVGPPHRSITISAVPVHRSDGSCCGAVAVLRDTTEDRHLEAVRRDFIANLSHELKTPIGALSLLADTMVVESAPDVMARLVERMQLETTRVSQVIDDLLSLSRIEGSASINLEVVRAGTIIDTAMNRVRFAAEHRGISIHTRGDLDATVYGSQQELVSALHHLLENALKYSNEATSVEIDVKRDGDWTEISVTDHGAGIASQYQERIFERFYRVDDARTRSTGGTGLGLSIVRHVVLNHGGEVGVISKEGEGSTFTIRLAGSPSTATERLVVEGGTDG